MSDDSAGLSANPMFGAIIGQQIANNKTAEMHQKHASDMAESAQRMGEAAVAQGQAAMNLAITAMGLKNQVEELQKEIYDLEGFDMGITSALAGVRGVTRELLAELRKADPSNPLLEKKHRDKVFDIEYNSQTERHKEKSWKDRKANASTYRDIAYGANGANDGGPEKSKISSNKAVRAEAGVPDHLTDRERFVSLIKELHNTLAAKDPNAPILKSQTMIDVFTEYELNEMYIQPISGGSKSEI